MTNIVRLISGVRTRMVLLIFLFQSISLFAQEERPLFLDYTRPFKVRVDDLLSRMTLEEKLSQIFDERRKIAAASAVAVITHMLHHMQVRQPQ